MSKIAFFDSGIGGLTVLAQAIKLLPHESYVYFADSKNLPYGTKTVDEIRSLVIDAVEFLSELELKALVIACNTATSAVVNILRQEYSFPIIGMEPAIKPATQLTKGKRILVCATDRTLTEKKLKDLIVDLNVEDRVDLMSLQSLVSFCENFDFHSFKLHEYLDGKFRDIDFDNYSAVVLGCTHFLFFKKLIESKLPDHISIIDGNWGTVKRLKSLVKESELANDFSLEFFESKVRKEQIYFDNFLRLSMEL